MPITRFIVMNRPRAICKQLSKKSFKFKPCQIWSYIQPVVQLGISIEATVDDGRRTSNDHKSQRRIQDFWKGGPYSLNRSSKWPLFNFIFSD